MTPIDSAPSDEGVLEDALSTPDAATTAALAALDGDVVILGAGGKMGPSLALMARRALRDAGRRVIAVSRFGDDTVAARLEAAGVLVHRADLSDPQQVAALPLAPNMVWMAGQKFGTTGDPVGTWTQNVVASVHAAERYAGARILCFSTGNVYGRSRVAGGGSREEAPLVPDGEYAASCVGRERVFESVARRTGSPLLLYRLFYANDLRYGVVTEIAGRVLRGEPIDLTTGFVNVIWQGDANRLALRALGVVAGPSGFNDSDPLKDGKINDSDPLKGVVALNVTGPIVPVREIAERCAKHAGVAPVFAGTEGAEALIADVARLEALLPYRALPLDTLCAWAVAWIRAGGTLLNKPTKFEVRDGKF